MVKIVVSLSTVALLYPMFEHLSENSLFRERSGSEAEAEAT